MARWLFTLTLCLWLAAAGRDGMNTWIDTATLPPMLRETSVEIRDRHGALMRAYPVGNGILRLDTGRAEVDPAYLRMLVRYEDKRFFSHHGVDPLAMLRAVAQALRHGRAVSGGSTLTMQVARLLEDGPTGRWRGKLRQIRLALALERRLGKDDILGLYLTHAPFGGNIEGVRAASFAWFGKEPRRLTPAQAALLVALPQAPESRRPDRHSQAAMAARNRILARLAEQGVLDPEDVAVARRAKVPGALRAFPRLAPHMGDALRGAAPEMAQFNLTIDASLQRRLEDLAGSAARRAGTRLSAAVIVADHRTGDILASVGSAGYGAAEGRAGFVDMTRAVRSPGSLLKPLVYGLAFDRGLAHPETLIRDAPVQFGSYAPRNFDGEFRGDLRVREALQQSLNIPVVKLVDALGPARLVAALEQSGAQVAIPGGKPGLAVALGGLGMTLHDLVQVYAALAQGGIGPALRASRLESERENRRLMGPEAAWMVGNILAGLSPPPGAPRGVLAYKTGTSYGHRDAWAIGYDGAHVIGVWLGRADGTPVPGAFGGELAAPVLFDAFGRLKPAFERLPPPPAATLIAATADLPPPLRRFRADRMDSGEGGERLSLSFPPDGARLALSGGDLVIKLRGGIAPFSVLANGAPVVVGAREREVELPHPGAGFSTLTVLDANGASDRVTVRID